MAPIKENDKVGEIVYSINGKKVGSLDLVAEESINKAKYKDRLNQVFHRFTL